MSLARENWGQTDAYRWHQIANRWADLMPDLCGTWPKLGYMEALATVGQRSRVCALLAERYDFSHDEADDALFGWQTELASREALGVRSHAR